MMLRSRGIEALEVLCLARRAKRMHSNTKTLLTKTACFLHHYKNRQIASAAFNYQNHLFCRLLLISVYRLRMETYITHGYGSQWYC